MHLRTQSVANAQVTSASYGQFAGRKLIIRSATAMRGAHRRPSRRETHNRRAWCHPCSRSVWSQVCVWRMYPLGCGRGTWSQVEVGRRQQVRMPMVAGCGDTVARSGGAGRLTWRSVSQLGDRIMGRAWTQMYGVCTHLPAAAVHDHRWRWAAGSRCVCLRWQAAVVRRCAVVLYRRSRR